VDEQDIPWSQLAFPSVLRTLQLYFADRAAGAFTLHDETIRKGDWERMGFDEQPNHALRLV